MINVYYYTLYIVTDLLSVLLSNGMVNKPQQRDRFYVVRYTTVAMQHRGKHTSAAIGRHATMRNVQSAQRLYNATLVVRQTDLESDR
jgi:hypothetical protein